jgi:hypothetical protein
MGEKSAIAELEVVARGWLLMASSLVDRQLFSKSQTFFKFGDPKPKIPVRIEIPRLNACHSIRRVANLAMNAAHVLSLPPSPLPSSN